MLLGKTDYILAVWLMSEISLGPTRPLNCRCSLFANSNAYIFGRFLKT